MENKFPNRLKELRQEKNLGHVKLARAIGVSNGTISVWENGINEPKMSHLVAIADFFEVSLDYLVGRTDYF